MKKRRRVTIKFKLMLLALFLVYIGVSVYIQQCNIGDLLKEQQALGERYEQAQTQLLRLEHKNEYMGTSKYIEKTAREKLGLVYEDELILTPNAE